MKTLLFKRTVASITSICLTLAFLSAAALQAEELKSFLTLKIASPSAILDVAEKIADLAGQKTIYEMAVNPYKELKGFNAKGSIGLVLRTNGDEIKEPLLILPITDLKAIDIPGFEAVLAGVKEVSDGKYLLNSPVGNYALEQKENFLLMFPEDSQEPLPEAPETLLADLDAYTIGIKVDMENASMDAINMLLAPFQMLMAMQGGEEAAKSVDMMLEAVEAMHKEVKTLTYGLTFDTKTADTEVGIIIIPKEGTDAAKQIAAMKDAKTAFSGFHSTGTDAIVSWNVVQTGTAAQLTTSMNSLEQIITGVLAQVEEQAEDDADVEFAKSLVDSLRTIIESTLKKDTIDLAGSFRDDATLLFAGTLAETEEVKKVAKKLFDYSAKDSTDVPDFFNAKYYSADYATLEGYKLSSIKFPFSELKAEGEDAFLNVIADKTLSLFWGFKENESVVFAAGLDFDKTKKTFESAVAKTKEPVPVAVPQLVFAVQPWAKLASTYLKEEEDNELQLAMDIFNKAGQDAKITVSSEAVGKGLKVAVFVSGKLIKAFADMASGVQFPGSSPASSSIGDF